jgi:hypothetical protein
VRERVEESVIRETSAKVGVSCLGRERGDVDVPVKGAAATKQVQALSGRLKTRCREYRALKRGM